jgi:hypothetical protein
MYFSTRTVTPPAMPPAKLAKPKNSTTLAFHATPDPEYEKLSAESRVFSIELMIAIPRNEKIRGSQSMKLTWTSLPFFADLDHTAASRRTKNASEAYNPQQSASASSFRERMLAIEAELGVVPKQGGLEEDKKRGSRGVT